MPGRETLPESSPLWIRNDSTLIVAGLCSNLERLSNQGFIDCEPNHAPGVQSAEQHRVPQLGGFSPVKVGHPDSRSKCVRACVRYLNSRAEEAGAVRKSACSMR